MDKISSFFPAANSATETTRICRRALLSRNFASWGRNLKPQPMPPPAERGNLSLPLTHTFPRLFGGHGNIQKAMGRRKSERTGRNKKTNRLAALAEGGQAEVDGASHQR
jgi:hypothetical protein